VRFWRRQQNFEGTLHSPPNVSKLRRDLQIDRDLLMHEATNHRDYASRSSLISPLCPPLA
jgi:hypothetical protein